MKRLLQRISDGLYYQEPGVWTNNPDLALAFLKTAAAIECCLRENLPPMQLVLKFEDSAFDIRVPCWNERSLADSHLRPRQPDPSLHSPGERGDAPPAEEASPMPREEE